MALSSFEREIIAELHRMIGKRVREKELLEWRTREIAKREGERVFHLEGAGVWVAIPETSLPKALRRLPKPSPTERTRTDE
jgi:hypothetical protein